VRVEQQGLQEAQETAAEAQRLVQVRVYVYVCVEGGGEHNGSKHEE